MGSKLRVPKKEGEMADHAERWLVLYDRDCVAEGDKPTGHGR